MPWALAHAAAKRELVAIQHPDDWAEYAKTPEVLKEPELVDADGELKALQRQAFEIVDPENG
jgi:hypothetical protein